jgi:hypothetical protein
MRSVPTVAYAGAAICAAALAVAAQASAATVPEVAPNYTFPDGSKVHVGFNPQPRPPGYGGSRDITPGGGRVTQIATPLGDTGYGFAWALMLIGIGGVGGLARTRTQAPSAGAGRSASCSKL